MATQLGFANRRTEAPKNLPELVSFLATIMSASVNNDVNLDNARVALNAATRIVDAIQADTRMKAVAAATGKVIEAVGGKNGWEFMSDKRAIEKK